MQFKISAATGIGSGTRHFRYFGSLTFLLFLQFLICFSAYAQPPVASGDCSRNILEFDVSENTGTTAISGFDYAEGSFEAWVRKDNWSDPYDDALFSNGIGHAHANSFYISFHSGVGIHFRYGGGEDTGSVAAYASNTSTDTLAANSWHHIAATWENDGSSTTLAVYIDAQLISTVSTSTNLVLNTANPFGLGLGVVNYLYDFQGGAMAEVSVWNIVKTQTEIESDMDRILSGDDLGLIAYWPLNDTPGSATASNTIQATETLSLLDFSDAYTAWAPFPMEIEVSGERILSGDTHDFGSIDVNTSSGAIIFTLTNNGSYTITFEDDPITVLTGNDADQFVLDLSSTASSLASGASTTFTVSFDPTSEGTKNASLALTNTASCSDPYIINLSGSTTNNSAPVITLGDPLVIDEDSQNQILSGISITDADNADVRMTWTCTNGYLTIGNQSGLTYIDGNGFQNETFTFTGSVADINANALNDAIAFTPTPDYYGSATITITIDDNLSGGGLTDTEVLNVTVNPVNDAPVITMGDDPTIDEDAVNAYMPAITVEDTDIGSASMRVTLSVTNGVLSTGANGGLIFINGDGSNDETITYTAPLSNVLTNLTSVAFTPTPDYNGTATLTITVDDAENGGGLTDTETYTITINPVNDAPVITMGDDPTIDEDAVNAYMPAITVEDTDIGSASMRVTLSVTNGVLSTGANGGLIFINGDGSNDETITYTAPLSNVLTNLTSVAFTPTPDYNGTATLTITVEDAENGGGLTDTESYTITINPVNDAPVITMGDDPTIDEDAVNAYMPAITVEDTDIGSASMRVTLSVTNGVLSTGANGGLIFINGDGSNDETITYTAPLSNVLTNLTSVAFTPTPDYNGTATLTITVDDAENGGGLTDTETYTITINPVPDPEISYSGAGFQEAIENDGALTGSIIITIFDDIFQDDDTDNLLDVGSEVTIGNIPAGLTPVMTLNSSTEAVLSLTGNASSHQGTDDVADITFEFTDAAFTNSMVADVPNATGPASSELGIDFNNNPFLTYSGNGFTELVSNDGSLDGSLLIALEGDTFQDIDSDGTLDAESQVIVGNLPNGVTPRISILDQLNPGGEWMTANNIAGSWQDVTYGAGTFVAVAYSGDVMTSNDGETWTLQTKPFNGFWSGVTYGDGVFVAVANASSGEQVMTSPDGVSWTAQTTPEANHWNDVIYANGQFVAVAFSGTNRVMTSPDGVDWTLRTAAENNPWRSLAYGGGLFVAVAQDGSNQVMTSDDGISWASRSAASAQTWKSVVYGDGLFVAVSGDGGVMTSPDGLNWTMRTAAESNSWTGVIYANGRFVAVSYSGNSTIMTSLDGIDWSAEDDLGTQGWTSIASGEGKFVAVGADATSGIHSYTHSFYGLELTLEGKAENHQNAHDVADITFDFDNSAFTNTGAPQVINATGPASSELGVDFTDNPDNDDCANPETLTVFEPGLGVPTEGSTEFSALASASIPCTIAPNVRDVWYSFNSGESGQVIFKVQHDEAATIEGAIYTACETIHETDNPFGDGSTPSCATDFSEPLYIVLAPNTEYLVRVWSPDEGKGDFTIMLEENLPPAIDEIVDKEVNEEQQLQFTVAATDDFVPDGQIEFFLQEESTGLGMSINASGEFSWTPGEDQDGSYEVTVIASDYFDFLTGFASYSTETFNITVNEVNTAPELGSVTAQDVAPEGSVYYQITATDTDLPEQTLLFSVDQASMDKGMYVDESDYLSWTPQPEHYGTTNNVEVTVSDGDLSATATLVITVGKAGQEIFFDSPGNYTYGETYSISLYADGGDSGNEVEFTSSDENVISISGSYANIIGAGEATIYANQAGNGNYNAAPEVSQTITISKADQYLSFDTPGSYTYGETATFELSAYGGDSGNPVVFTSSDDNVISISGSTATIEGAGDVTIYADQDGNGNYNPAEQQSAYMSIYKADQYIIFDYFDSKTYGDEPFEISATGGASTSPVVFTSSNESVVTVSGTTVTIVGAGDATIYANQAGDNNYNAAYEESQSVYVDKAEQLLIFEPISDKTFGGGTFELSATGGGSPNPVVFNTYDEGVIQISGSTVSIVGAGNATIYASQAGDDSYYQANEEYQYFEVFKATQEIVFDPIETKIQGDPAFALPEFSSVGLPITYDVDEGFIAYVDENIITITGSGSTTITAYQYGDDNYLEASPVQQTLNVEELWIWTGSWNNGFPPSSDDNARLDADFTFAGEMSFEVNNLTVSPNVTLAVAPENTLEVMGDLDNKGTMLIESGASLITYAASSVLGNDITIRRNTRYANGKYSFVGTPVMQSATMTTSNLGAHVYTYDESQSDVVEDLSRWVSASEADQLMPGQGYTQANQQLIEFAGVPNTGTITYSGSYQNDGWHLVSNPYAAAIDIDNFLDANTNTTGAIYIWDDNDSQTGRGTNDDYIVANKTAVTDISGPDNQSRWNGHIGSAQGFFVQLDGAEGNVTFTEGMRVHNNNSDDNYFRAAEISILRLNLISTDGLTKQAIVGWNETVSDEELVSGYDAPAFNLNADYAIYTEKANEYLTIQTITSQRLEIPVGFNVAEAGYYSLDFVKENLSADLYLYDNQTDEHVDISLGSYSFYTEAGQIRDRFVLVRKSKTLDLSQITTNIYAYNKILTIETNRSQPAAYRLFDLSGHEVLMAVITGPTVIDLNHLSNGVYLVTDGIESKKIVLK